jgi:HEPN domain-containing protein
MNRSREMAEVLLEKAKGDLAMLEYLAGGPKMPDWGIGFHAQQAAEKAIKAVLCFLNIEYPYTHNIAHLLDLLQAGNHPLPPDTPRLSELTIYGAMTRYGGPSQAAPPETKLGRAWVLGAVRRTVDWASGMLGEPEHHD